MVPATKSVRSREEPLIPDFHDACGAVTSKDSNLDVFGMIDNHSTHVN